MDTRTRKVTVHHPGGTAKGNATAYKISLPTKWMKEMGFLPEDRDSIIIYNPEKKKL